jgi:energy-coupling factor transporter ATP-binding protein EcfA2
MDPQPARHGTILIVDVERFGNPQRIDSHRASVRKGLYAALDAAFRQAGIDRTGWRQQDTGDGVLMLAPPELVKGPLAAALPRALAEALRAHNEEHPPAERIRLRMALHAGEIIFDEHGMTGQALVMASRLLDSDPLRAALARSPGVLALAVSSWFFENVVRQHPASGPETYRKVLVTMKEGDTEAWLGLPDAPYPPREVDSVAHADPATKFEHRYVNYVREDNSTFELFQVNRGSAPVGYSFDEFYVIPPIARRQTVESSSGLTGTGTDAVNAIAEARRVLLMGGPGAGKTTFLRWLAYLVATQRHQEGPWHRVVPFYLSLRRFAGTPLPAGPEELLEVTAPMLRTGKPADWVSGLFDEGRAMLLVDGLDELVAEERENAKRWLEMFVRSYRDARYIVSTRPSAVGETWFADTDDSLGLVRFDLLGLSSGGLQRVIDRWYAAALKRETDPRQQAWLSDCSTRLWEGLSTRPNLRSLVSSPLLAGLICALYRQNNQYLPRTRRELLEQALDLLLERWDHTKTGETTPSVEDELRLNRAQKRVLLERIAATMVRGSELTVSMADAVKRLRRAMTGLRSEDEQPEPVLRHLMVRTGLIREVRHDQRLEIEFVHRTFRDYLAANEMVKAGDLGMLVSHAHEDSWYEVVFMAAAQAREREVAELLTRMLKRAGVRGTAKDVANRLKLVAAACLGYADVVDPDQVRVDVQEATQGLIPPTAVEAAELLAKAGPFVVDLLPGPDELAEEPETAARVIRTLAMVGGEEAREKLRLFADMHHSTVIDELLRGWRAFEFSEEYATDLLSHVDFRDRVYEERRWDMLPRLRHLVNLRYLKLIGNLPLADERTGRHPLAGIHNLVGLEIVSNEVVHDLSPLLRCRNLRVLKVSGYSVLQDLSALAHASVEELELRTVTKTTSGASIDLRTLAGARVRRLAIQHADFARGLYSLPADLPLVELFVTNRAERRSLLGIARWPSLTHVAANGLPTAAEIAELGKLADLRRLDLYEVSEEEAAAVALPGVTVLSGG